MQRETTVLCLMGPTGAGKSRIALALAQHIPCEIISVDSALIYRGMDIGTAKPTITELTQVPHHLIDIRDPAESYSAGDFREDALRLIDQIFKKNKIPLLVGGTMLYFKTLQQGISTLPKANPDIRLKLVQEAEKLGWPMLYERLKKIDPFSASHIQPNDTQRIQRALEVFILTEKPISEWHRLDRGIPFPHPIQNIALAPSSREILHQLIEQRFEKMLEQGFIEEVRKLHHRPDLNADLPSMRAVGYRQIWKYLEGMYDFEEMKKRAIAATRQLAKRQLTWLKSWKDVQWFDSLNPEVHLQILNSLKP